MRAIIRRFRRTGYQPVSEGGHHACPVAEPSQSSGKMLALRNSQDGCSPFVLAHKLATVLGAGLCHGAPANDAFESAQSLGNSLGVAVAGTVENATSQFMAGEPDLSEFVFWVEDMQTWDDTETSVEPVGVPQPTGDGISEIATDRLINPGAMPRKKFFRVEARPKS